MVNSQKISVNPKHKIRTKQKGGIRLGKGGFGCVVKPAVQCSKKNKSKFIKHKVSKLIFRDTDGDNIIKELKLYNAIKKLDPKENYFLSYHQICRLKKKFIHRRRDIRLVKFRDNKGKNKTIVNSRNSKEFDEKVCDIDMSQNPINMIQYFGGISLETLFTSKNKKMKPLKKKLKGNIKKYLRNLLIGLKKLHKGGIVHRDIKEDNIMVKMLAPPKSKQSIKNSNMSLKPSIANSNLDSNQTDDKEDKVFKVRYIDYGLSDFVSDLNEKFEIRIKGTIGYISPEVFILKNIFNKFSLYQDEIFLNENIKQKIFNTITDDLKKYIGKYFKELYITKNIISSINNTDKDNQDFDFIYKNGIYSKESLETLTYKFYNYLKNRQLVRNVLESKNIKGFVYKIDIFALGIVFYNIYTELDMNNAKLLDLISQMLQLDPETRPSAIECLKHSFFK
jgi:serine/threonine protein kinase